MNITFVFGNGFDLSANLKTRYMNFYPYFMDNASDENLIKINSKSEDVYDDWADLELFLGRLPKSFGEEPILDYMKSKEELEKLLIEYLDLQQKAISSNEIIRYSEEFVRSIKEFEQSLPEAFERRTSSIRTNHYGKLEYKFITLNYTDFIDRMVNNVMNDKKLLDENIYKDNYKISKVEHIHGTLDSGMILGVNDSSQILNSRFATNEFFLDSMIKQKMNTGNGYNRLVRAKHIIDNSVIIYIFGASLGKTDNGIWTYISNWASGSKEKVLIINSYNDEYNLIKSSSARYQREKNTIIEDFISRNATLSATGKNMIRNNAIVTFEPSVFQFS